MGMINSTVGVFCRGKSADLTPTKIKRQTALIPPPRPSTETLVTLCWKDAEVVAAVPVWGKGGVIGWFSTGHSGLIIINHPQAAWLWLGQQSFHLERRRLQDQSDGSASVAATCLQNGGLRLHSGTYPTWAARIWTALLCKKVQKFLHQAELLIHILPQEHHSQHNVARMCPV